MEGKELLLNHRIKPESSIYIQEGHFLRISALTSTSSTIIGFTGQYIDRNGKLSQFYRQLAPANDSVAVTATFELGECFLLGAMAYVVSGTVTYGQAYASARVQIGDGSAAVPLQVLFQSFVDANFSPTFPGGVNIVDQNITTSSGTSETITLTENAAPAAGAEFTVTVPAAQQWRLISLGALFTAAAGGSNRVVRLTIDDGTDVIAKFTAELPTAPTFADYYTFAAHCSYVNSTNTDCFVIPIGAPILKAGYRIKSTVLNIAGGDQWSAQQVLYGLT